MAGRRGPIRDLSQVKNSSVFWIGVLAGGMLSVLTEVLRLVGISNLNLAMILSHAIPASDHGTGLVFGRILHLFVSGLWAYAYAFLFRSSHRTGAAVGSTLGLFHGVIAGILVGLFTQAGYFASGFGLDAAAIYFLIHIGFGAIVGGLFDRAAMVDRYPRPLTQH